MKKILVVMLLTFVLGGCASIDTKHIINAYNHGKKDGEIETLQKILIEQNKAKMQNKAVQNKVIQKKVLEK
jgi:uncharacterized protein YceK